MDITKMEGEGESSSITLPGQNTDCLISCICWSFLQVLLAGEHNGQMNTGLGSEELTIFFFYLLLQNP